MRIKNVMYYLIILQAVLFFYSCSSTKLGFGVKKKIKYIDYIFPEKVDSVILHYISLIPVDDIEQHFYIDIIKDPKFEEVYTIRITYSYHPFNGSFINKKNKKQKRSSSFGDAYIVSKTNRYAIINKGQYKLPIVFWEDRSLVGYGRTEYPIPSYTPHSYFLEIKVNFMDIIDIIYYPNDKFE
jgi:hypothetical protein